MMFKYLAGLLFIFCIQAKSFSQAKFSAVCSDKKIGKNDYVQVQFVVENAANVQDITPPSFSNFTVVSGPNQQSGMTSINGNVKQYVSLDFVLKPLSTGSLTIPPATAKADGKDFRSDPVTIRVTNTSTVNKSGGNAFSSPFNLNFDMPVQPEVHEYDDYILHKGENIDDKIRKNIFVRVDVNKTSCFLGEPILATYKLYTRLKSESSLTKTPSFNGFSVKDIAVPDNPLTTEKFNGREYSVYVLRKVLLYPLQSGTFSLEPIEVENHVTFLKAAYAGAAKGDVFYDLLRDFATTNSPADAVQSVTMPLKSKPQDIVVKPLPDAGKPVNFKGAVGNYKINASVDKPNITTDDAGNLKVAISGSGNIELINAPVVSWPQGLEGFDAKANENIDKTIVPIRGEKIFNYAFTAAHPGDYEIPAVEFSYFDLATQSYKTVSTGNIAVHFEKGTGNPRRVQNILQADKKKEDKSFLDAISDYKWHIFAGVLFITLLLVIFSKRSSYKKNETIDVAEVISKPIVNEVINEPQSEFTIPANPLADVEKALIENNPSEFYHVLDTSLKKYLSQKLQVPEEELTKKRITERLDKCNVGIGTTLLLNSLLEDIDMNLYAPISPVNHMQDVYERANEFVGLLDKQVC